MEASAEPDTKLPLGKMANAFIVYICPVSVKSKDPLFEFHILTVLS